MQTNTAIVPNSLEQYITAVEETYNATSQPTTIEQPSGDSQSSGGSSDDGGFLSTIGSAIGAIGSNAGEALGNTTFGKVISTIGSFDNLETLASAAVDTIRCAPRTDHRNVVTTGYVDCSLNTVLESHPFGSQRLLWHFLADVRQCSSSLWPSQG